MQNNIDFRSIRNVRDLSRALGCPEKIFLARDPDDLRLHQIPKHNRSRGKRIVWEVRSAPLQQALRAFQFHFTNFALEEIPSYPHPCVHGYIPRRSIFTNASVHAGAKHLLKADIKDFFSSIKSDKIGELFLQLGISKDVTQLLCNLLTVEESLPLGFCTSPLIANVLCLNLDKSLLKLAQENSCSYTRYADDLSFSSFTSLPNIRHIEQIIESEGFEVAKDKLSIKKHGQAMFVTGLSINDRHPRVPYKWKHALRQELYFIEKFGLDQHIGRKGYSSYQSGINKITGKIQYLKSIEPQLGKSFLDKWNMLLEKEEQEPVYTSDFETNQIRPVEIYFDEKIVTHLNKRYLLLGCCLIEDVVDIEETLSLLLDDLNGDVYLRDNKQNLNGIYWDTLGTEAKLRVSNKIALLPMRTFCVFAEVHSDESIQAKYEYLFEELIFSRYISLNASQITFKCSNRISVPNHLLQSISNRIYFDQVGTNGRRPKNKPQIVSLNVAQSPSLALIDCQLGVFSEYFWQKFESESEKALTVSRFERLRNKFRYIAFCENEEVKFFFSRFRPVLTWEEVFNSPPPRMALKTVEKASPETKIPKGNYMNPDYLLTFLSQTLVDISEPDFNQASEKFSGLREVDALIREVRVLLVESNLSPTLVSDMEKDEDFLKQSRRVRLEALYGYLNIAIKLLNKNKLDVDRAGKTLSDQGDNHMSSEKNYYRVLLFSALNEELDYFLVKKRGFEGFQHDFNWEIRHERLSYHRSELEVPNGKTIEIIAASAGMAGLTQTSIKATQFFDEFQPNLAIMVGICGAFKDEGINLGDVIIPSQSFLYFYGAYKNGALHHEMKNENVNHDLLTWARTVFPPSQIRSAFEEFPDTGSGKPSTMPASHFGPMACGDLVVKDNSIAAHAQDGDRKVQALDMESYAFLRAASQTRHADKAIVIKSATDFADPEKNDKYREYCKFVASFLAKEVMLKSSSLPPYLKNHVDDIAQGTSTPTRKPAQNSEDSKKKL